MGQPSNGLLAFIRHQLAEATTADVSDRELLRRFASQRDEAAFQVIVRRHGPMVLRVCRRTLRQQAHAEDVFQATFLLLAQKAGSLTMPGAVGTWLYQVASRMARRARGKELRQHAREANASLRSASDPLADITGRELVVTLDEELQNLPERHRAPLLCSLDGKSGEESAKSLGWSLRTFKRRLHEAREILRERLQRRGFTLSIAAFSALLVHKTASASVPPALTAITIRAASLLVAKQPLTAGAVSAYTLALVRGTTRAMFLAKLKTAVAVAAVAGGLATGTSFIVRHGSAEKKMGSPHVRVRVAAGRERSDARWTETDAGERPRLDFFGDPLPKDAIARLGTLRFRHDCPVGPIATLTNGSTIATASGSSISVWHASTGKLLTRFVLSEGVNHFASTPDGNGSPSWDPTTSSVFWMVPAAEEIRRFVRRETDPPLAGGPVSGMLFGPRPDSLVVWARGTDRGIRVWNTSTGKETHRFENSGYRVHCVTISADGKLAAASVHHAEEPGQPVRLWDVQTGRELRRFFHSVGQVAFSPNGGIIVAASTNLDGRHGTLVRWDVLSGRELGSFIAHDGDISSIQFSPDGAILATAGGGDDKTIRCWDVASGRLLCEMGPLAMSVGQIVFTPDGQSLISRQKEHRVQIWDPKTGRERIPLDAPARRIAALAYSSRGNLFAMASRSAIRVHDLATFRGIHTIDRRESEVAAIAFSSDNTFLVSGSEDGGIYFWDTGSWKELHHIHIPTGRLQGVNLSPDGTRLAVTTSEMIDQRSHPLLSLWHRTTAKELRRLDVSAGRAACGARTASFSPDGKTLIGGNTDDTYLWRWDAETGKELLFLGPHNRTPFSAVFSFDGRTVATTTDDGYVYFWEIVTGQLRFISQAAHEQSPLAFSPDGRFLAVANNVRHRSFSGGTRQSEMDRHGWENCIQARLLDTNDGEVIHAFRGHSAGVDCLAFSPDGAILASGSRDTTVLLWDVAPWILSLH